MPRRAEALSRERIVEAAIAILDADGEAALTFRALTTRLATGAGAIYWHVANKGELLAAATDAVVAGVVAAPAAEPRAAIRALALRLFDAIDAHPWVGAQLHHEPWRTANLVVYEGIGAALVTLGVPDGAQVDCGAALVNYILGVAGQNAANARRGAGLDRTAYLTEVAGRWTEHDPAEFPFVHRMAAQLPGHDDRAQFLVGIDLILAGIATVR